MKSDIDFAVVGEGRTTAVAGAVAITLHATTSCRYFYFYLDVGSSAVHVSTKGADATAAMPTFDDSMGPRTIRLHSPATTITVFFDGAAGALNWAAGVD